MPLILPVHRTLIFLGNRCPSERLLHILVIYSAMISRTLQTSELKQKILPRKLIIVMLYSFSCCDQFTKTGLLQISCLSLPGSATWKLSCLQLKSLEVTFNNTLRKVWCLPRKCNASILHLTASLDSMYNTIHRRSLNFLQAAISSSSKLLRDVFIESSKLAFCVVGYNYLFGARHWKYYTEQDSPC